MGGSRPFQTVGSRRRSRAIAAPPRDCAWSHRGALSSDFGPKLWGKSSDKEQETNV